MGGFREVGEIKSAEGAFPITPSNANPLERPTRALYVGVTGNVRVQLVNGTVVTLTGLVAGIVHPIKVIQVYASGTTATNILGLF